MQIEQKASISLPPGSSDSEESMCNAGDQGSIPGLGRSPEEGNGYPLYYSCLENSMDIGDWQATVYGGHKESDATEQLSFFFSPPWSVVLCVFSSIPDAAKIFRGTTQPSP